MYYNCKSLEKIPDIPNGNLQNVKNKSCMIREIPMLFRKEEIIRDKDVSCMKNKCNNLEQNGQFFLEVDKKRMN